MDLQVAGHIGPHRRQVLQMQSSFIQRSNTHSSIRLKQAELYLPGLAKRRSTRLWQSDDRTKGRTNCNALACLMLSGWTFAAAMMIASCDLFGGNSVIAEC
jgi:hypothetical protein